MKEPTKDDLLKVINELLNFIAEIRAEANNNHLHIDKLMRKYETLYKPELDNS